MKALVLSGGGALGAYEAGAISVLCAEYSFDLVCGTSIGALNASYVAQHRLNDLYITWSTIAKRGVITLDPLAQHISDFANAVIGFEKQSAPLRKLVSLLGLYPAFRKMGSIGAVMQMLGGLSPDPIAAVLKDNLDFSRLAMSLVVSGTNLSTGNSDAFYWFQTATDAERFVGAHDKGLAHALTPDNFRDAVRASSAIPFAFAPVPIATMSASSLFVDGGVANNTPLGVAIDAGADDVTVIFLNPEDHHAPQAVSNLAEVGLTCFSIMQERIIELDFAAAERVNKNIARGSGGGDGSTGERRPVTLREMRPATTLPITVLQFDRQDLIDKVYAMGVADAKAAVAGWSRSADGP